MTWKSVLGAAHLRMSKSLPGKQSAATTKPKATASAGTGGKPAADKSKKSSKPQSPAAPPAPSAEPKKTKPIASGAGAPAAAAARGGGGGGGAHKKQSNKRKAESKSPAAPAPAADGAADDAIDTKSAAAADVSDGGDSDGGGEDESEDGAGGEDESDAADAAADAVAAANIASDPNAVDLGYLVSPLSREQLEFLLATLIAKHPEDEKLLQDAARAPISENTLSHEVIALLEEASADGWEEYCEKAHTTTEALSQIIGMYYVLCTMHYAVY